MAYIFAWMRFSEIGLAYDPETEIPANFWMSFQGFA